MDKRVLLIHFVLKQLLTHTNSSQIVESTISSTQKLILGIYPKSTMTMVQIASKFPSTPNSQNLWIQLEKVPYESTIQAKTIKLQLMTVLIHHLDFSLAFHNVNQGENHQLRFLM